MANINWPPELPQSPLIEGFQESSQNNAIRSVMDQGKAKVRRRTTAAPRNMTYAFIMTEAQVQILDDFYLEDLFSGALPYNFEHPRTQEIRDHRIKSPPSWIPVSYDKYRVTFPVEVLIS